jgi:hypothetical protein
MSPRERQSITNNNDGASVDEVPLTRRKNSVEFGEIRIREYNRIVGDHPDATNGVPMAIGWDFIQQPPLPIDQYEKERPSKRRVLRLNSVTRKNMLINVFQVPEEEINRAERQVFKIQKQREHTSKQGVLKRRAEIVGESLKRRFQKMFFAGDDLYQGWAVASGSMIDLQ